MVDDTASQYAKPGPYVTTLPSEEEKEFQGWVKSNNIPWQDTPTADYDMRGFWKANKSGDPNAKRSSKNLHFPDTYKTPYHKTFSRESKYATSDAPHWDGDKLIDKSGRVIVDESKGQKMDTPTSQNAPGSSQDVPIPYAAGMTPSDAQNGPISQPGANNGQPTQPQGPPPEAVADIGHHYGLGKIVQSLFGNDRSYSVDPKTGQTVPTDAPAKPGQIWRNIIAGVVLGGAAGQDKGKGNFLGGAVQGGKAEIEENQKQDAQKQANARKDFEQGIQARQANTAEQHANTQMDLMKAQIAMHNAQTLREMQNAQFEDFEHHDKMGEAGKARLDPFLKAGVPKKFDNIPETDIPDLLKNNPDATHLFWQPTGSTIVQDKNGNPQHVATMSAVDIRPGTKVKISDDNIKAWKDAGLDKLYGNDIFEHLKKDKEIDVQQYMTFTEKEQSISNDKSEKKKKKLTEDEEAAKIKFSNAQTAHLQAETGKIYTEAKDKKQADEAWKLFTGSGGDISKMTPDQIKKLKPITDTLIKAADEERKEFGDQLRNNPEYGNTAEGKEKYKNMESYHNAVNRIMGLTSKLPSVSASGSANGIPPISDRGKEYIKAALLDTKGQPVQSPENSGGVIWTDDRLSPTEKLSVTKQFGAVMPWSAVEEFSKKAGISPDSGASQLQSAGIKVEKKPSSKPEPSNELDTSTLD